MKIKSGYLLRQIADTYVVVPVGEKVIEFRGLITINELGKFIWDLLSNEITYDDLLKAILNEYEVEAEKAKSELDVFLNEAKRIGVIEE